MSGISLSSELAGLVETFGWTWRDLNWLTINAMKSAFYPFDDRLALIDGRIKPGICGSGVAAGGLGRRAETGAQASFGDDALID